MRGRAGADGTSSLPLSAHVTGAAMYAMRTLRSRVDLPLTRPRTLRTHAGLLMRCQSLPPGLRVRDAQRGRECGRRGGVSLGAGGRVCGEAQDDDTRRKALAVVAAARRRRGRRVHSRRGGRTARVPCGRERAVHTPP